MESGNYDSALPVSWLEIPLGDEVEYKKGKKPKVLEENQLDDLVPYIDIKAFEKKIIRKYADQDSGVFAVEDDSLMVWDGARSGLVGNGINGVIGSTLMRVRPIGSHNKYLHYFLQSKYQEVNTNTKGTGIPHVDPMVLWNINYPIAPLNEQIRIANKLDSLLTKVEAAQTRLEKIPKILKRFRESVLAAATSGELTKEWRMKNETEDIKILVDKVNIEKKGKLKVRVKNGWGKGLKLFELPNNWAWIQNHKLSEDNSNAICAGPFGTIFKAKDFRKEGVPIIFLRHVKESGFNQNKPKYMDRSVWDKLHQEYSVFGGELLVAKLGDPPGESCIYPDGCGTAMVTPDILKMNVDKKVAETKYLMYFFNSPICKQFIGDLAFGVTRLRIDIAMFKLFQIPLPPRDEQVEIVRRVESLFTLADTVEKQYKEGKKRVDKLTQSILAKAFRGELVQQDPNDEPAEQLLQRVKAQREQEAQKAPKKKRATKKKAIKKVKAMKLDDAPKDYLVKILHKNENKMWADELWKASSMSIDDFYEKLSQEVDDSLLVEAFDEPEDRMTEKRYLIAC